MQDLFWQLKDTDAFTVYMTARVCRSGVLVHS